MPLSLHCYFLCVSSPFSQIASTVGLVFSVAGKSSRKWTMRCFDGVVTVVDADNDAHGKYLHFLYYTIYNKRLPFGASEIFAWKKRFIGIVPTNRHWGIGEHILTVVSPSDIICSWLSPPNYEGGERLSFQEIILLLTFIGSCIYATVSLTLKVLEFLLQNKKSRWLGLKSAAKRKHSHKAAIIMKIALRFRKAIFGAPSGTRTQDPLIKSQLLYQLS